MEILKMKNEMQQNQIFWPVGIETVKEVLHSFSDSLRAVDAVQLEDSLRHSGDSVQVSSSYHVQGFCETLQVFVGSILFLIHYHVPDLS